MSNYTAGMGLKGKCGSYSWQDMLSTWRAWIQKMCFGLSKGFNSTHCNYWHTNYELSMYAWIHSGNFPCRAVLQGFDYHSSQSGARNSCCSRTWRVKGCRWEPRTHSRWFFVQTDCLIDIGGRFNHIFAGGVFWWILKRAVSSKDWKYISAEEKDHRKAML